MAANKAVTATFVAATTTGAPVVTSVTLINADTDVDIRALTNGTTIDFAAIGTTHLNFRANIGANTASVKFGYDTNPELPHRDPGAARIRGRHGG